MILLIAARELRSMFFAPIGWAIMAISQFILAYLFLAQVDNFLHLQSRLVSVPDAPGLTAFVVVPLFSNSAVLLLMIIPLLAQRLVSEEKRAGTLPVLFSAPLSMTEIVLGKYLGIMLFLGILLLLIAAMPLTLLVGGHLDMGVFGSAFLGLVLLVASFSALGLFVSTLTAQPSLAALGSFGLLMFFWIVDWAGNLRGDEMSGLFAYFSLLRHYEPLVQGVVDSRDVMYYLLFTVLFLGLSVRRLHSERVQK